MIDGVAAAIVRFYSARMGDAAPFRISAAETAEDIAEVAGLFAVYASAVGVDLGYQDFAAELAGLPGKYAPPLGVLLVARDRAEHPVGCVALRPLARDGCCEMKRLYVSPAGRGLGAGKALVNAVVQEARRIGYREMRLDSLPSMTEAVRLYRGCGFTSIEPYYETPVAGTIFLARSLLD